MNVDIDKIKHIDNLQNNSSSELNKNILYKFKSSPDNFSKLFKLIGREYEGYNVDAQYTTVKMKIKNKKIEIYETANKIQSIISTLVTKYVIISIIAYFTYGMFGTNVFTNLIMFSVIFLIILDIIDWIKTEKFSRGIFNRNNRLIGVFNNQYQTYSDLSDNRENVIFYECIYGYVITYKIYRLHYGSDSDCDSYRYVGFYIIDMVLNSGDIIPLLFNKSETKTVKEAQRIATYTNKPIFYFNDYETYYD